MFNEILNKVTLLKINFFKAYLTTRGTIMSMLHILAKRPDVQKSLQTEIDNVIGDVREPEIRDRQQCPLLEAFVLETLRYISPMPMALHFSRESTSMAGNHIEKSTTVSEIHSDLISRTLQGLIHR